MLKRIHCGIIMLSLFHEGLVMAFQLNSPAFEQGQLIPSQFTCDGDDNSPALQWSGIPKNTRSFVLIMDDPDAPVGMWDHWLLFNIPATVDRLAQGVIELPVGALSGKNSWGRTGYGGPCPPDREHRYFFKLYALDIVLTLKDGVSKKALEAAMKDHILAQSELMGRYDRQR